MGETGLISHARRVNSVLCSQMDGLSPGIDQYVARSWHRCVNDYHLDPLQPRETPVVQRQRLLERIEAAGELFQIATEESRNIYAQTRGSGYVIAVTDSDGVILSWIADPALDKEFAKTGMRTGAIWHERHKGTNGMGTCLAEGIPVTIHNQDHFFGSHANLTCTGVPIHSTSGEIAAILDASSLHATSDKAGQIYTSALLQMSAKRIEHCFFLKTYGSEIVLRINRWAELIGTIDDALIALDVTGRILAVNDVALDQLQLANRGLLIGRNLDEILDMPLERLLSAYHDAGNAPVTVRSRASGIPFFAIAREPSHKPRTGSGPAAPKPPAGDTPSPSLEDIAGTDPGMRASVSRARSVINKAVPILLNGETGTGKNAFARALHNESGHRDQPFVSINCAAISKQDLENELRGLPWQSSSCAADGTPVKPNARSPGTLFLDEVEEMDEGLQSRFLAILEDLDDPGTSSSDPDGRCRPHIISASKTNLADLVEQGTFRKDLYYRLYGLQLDLVPLARRADKEQVIRNVLDLENQGGKPVQLTESALERLRAHPWEGNFRELHLVLRTALAMAGDSEIREEHLPGTVGRRGDPAVAEHAKHFHGQSERDALVAALQRNRWNVSRTASMLNVSRNTLYRKMNQFRIPKKTD